MIHKPAFIAEHHIQLLIRSIMKPGACVFDVGANRGWLTVNMARIVGKRGLVVCFEPSPRNLDELSAAIQKWLLTNVEIVPAAVYHETGRVIEFYQNSFSNTDSIYFHDENASKIPVRTIALDDYVQCMGYVADLIKMDVEGAEYDVLQGATRLIETAKPVLILEMRASHPEPLSFLLERGYRAYSCHDLQPVAGPEWFADGSEVEDVVFIHRDADARPAFSAEGDAPFEPVAFQAFAEGRYRTVTALPVEPGLNSFRLDVDCSGNATLGVYVLHDGMCRAHFSGTYGLIAKPYLRFNVVAQQAGTISVFIDADAEDGYDVTGASRKLLAFASDEAARRYQVLDIAYPFGMSVDEMDEIINRMVHADAFRTFDTVHDCFSASESSHPRLLYFAGVRSLRGHDPARAVDLLSAARDRGADAHWSNYMLALAFRELGRVEEAKLALDAARRANPESQFAKELGMELVRS